MKFYSAWDKYSRSADEEGRIKDHEDMKIISDTLKEIWKHRETIEDKIREILGVYDESYLITEQTITFIQPVIMKLSLLD